MGLNDWLKQRKARREQEELERQKREDEEPGIFDLFLTGAAIVHTVNKHLEETAEQRAQHVLVYSQGTITYTTTKILSSLATIYQEDHDSLEKEIRDILDANPDADFHKYEKALGIKIVDIQRKNPESVPSPTHDNIIGIKDHDY